MKWPLKLISIVIAAVRSASAGVTIDPAHEASLATGEVVLDVHVDDRVDAARVSAAIDIPAPREKVWAVMIDCARAPHFVPDLKSCRVIERDPAGAWDVREHIIDWTWILPNIRNVFRSDYEAPHILRFMRVDGDLAISEGTWRLEPSGGGTRVFYDALLSPNSWVPVSLALSSVRSDVPKILKALRHECAVAP